MFRALGLTQPLEGCFGAALGWAFPSLRFFVWKLVTATVVEILTFSPVGQLMVIAKCCCSAAESRGLVSLFFTIQLLHRVLVAEVNALQGMAAIGQRPLLMEVSFIKSVGSISVLTFQLCKRRKSQLP